MSDDTELSPGAGGDKIRQLDKSPGVKGKTQVIVIDMGGGGVEDITSTPATQATLASLLAELLLKARLTDTQPVSAASLPLPTGAATEAGNLATIAAKDFATQTTLALVKAKTDNLDVTLSGGSQKSQLYDPNIAQSAMVDQLRGIRTSQVIRVFGDSFADGIGTGADAGSFPSFVTISGAGSGGVSGGQLTLRTGGSASGNSATLQSNSTLVFVTGAISGFQSGVQFPTTPTTWKIVSRKDGIDSSVTVFNGTANTPDGNWHRYEIFFQGPGSAKFMVDGVLLHSLSGQPSAVRTSTLDLYLRYEISNDSTNTTARVGTFDSQNGYFYEAVYTAADLTMNVRGSTALRLGPQVDDSGYPLPLPLNAAKENNGNLALILEYMVSQQFAVLSDIRRELKVLNTNLCSGLNLLDETEDQRDDPYYNQ